MEFHRYIINGNLIQMYNGKKVSVTGVIGKVQADGLSFDMRSVDNVNIKVKLMRPMLGAMQGLVVVHGIAQGNSIASEDVIHFAEEYVKDFDSAAHNQLCILLHSNGHRWKMI